MTSADTMTKATEATKPPVEWNAAAYHALSNPQFGWGMAVLAGLSLRGDESVIDAGCGSGRLTAELLLRLPRGRVLAVDRSQNMLDEAQRNLVPRFAGRVSFLCTDLLDLAVSSPADLVFSTATFHWVLDQAALYRRLFAALAPGGRLVAQCGGGPNIAKIRARGDAVRVEAPFAPHFEGYREPWVYLDAAAARALVAQAGFIAVETEVTAAPSALPDETTFRDFLRHVVFRVDVERLPGALADRFLDRLVELSRDDPEPWSLDYHRLNVRARRAEE
jgi:trans-aconitate 2-methyltransferase